MKILYASICMFSVFQCAVWAGGKNLYDFSPVLQDIRSGQLDARSHKPVKPSFYDKEVIDGDVFEYFVYKWGAQNLAIVLHENYEVVHANYLVLNKNKSELLVDKKGCLERYFSAKESSMSAEKVSESDHKSEL